MKTVECKDIKGNKILVCALPFHPGKFVTHYPAVIFTKIGKLNGYLIDGKRLCFQSLHDSSVVDIDNNDLTFLKLLRSYNPEGTFVNDIISSNIFNRDFRESLFEEVYAHIESYSMIEDKSDSIIIEVRGGVVTCVSSSNPNTKVTLVDHDNINSGDYHPFVSDESLEIEKSSLHNIDF